MSPLVGKTITHALQLLSLNPSCLLSLSLLLKMFWGTGNHERSNTKAYFQGPLSPDFFLYSFKHHECAGGGQLLSPAPTPLLTFTNCLFIASLIFQLSGRTAISKDTTNILNDSSSVSSLSSLKSVTCTSGHQWFVYGTLLILVNIWSFTNFLIILKRVDPAFVQPEAYTICNILLRKSTKLIRRQGYQAPS